MHDFCKITPPHSNMDHIPYNDRIELAIAELESQNRINYASTARKYNIDRSTLSRRHKSETGAKKEATSNFVQALTNAQEKILVTYVNQLSARGMPPTPQILKNIAEELANVKLGKNWPSRFRARYGKEMKSLYLRTIDHKRKLADNSHHFEHYFENVRAFFACFYLCLLP